MSVLRCFARRTPKQVRQDMLLEAELSLLDQQRHRDYHTAMCQMLERRVQALRTQAAADALDEANP